MGTEVSLARLAPFVWQNGGEIADRSVRPRYLRIYEEPGIEAAQWFVDWQRKEHVVPDAVAERAEDSESRFMNGRMAMYLNSRRGVPTYRTITRFAWDVAPLPREKHAATVLHADGFFMPKQARDKAAVWRFIEFATSPEGQRIVAASGRTVPSLRSVAESSAFLDPRARPASSRVFLDTLPVMRAMPVHPRWVDVEEIFDDELERAYYGRATLHEALVVALQRSQEYLRQ